MSYSGRLGSFAPGRPMCQRMNAATSALRSVPAAAAAAPKSVHSSSVTPRMYRPLCLCMFAMAKVSQVACHLSIGVSCLGGKPPRSREDNNMTATANAETFTSSVGVFPTSVITPDMVRALDTVDDNGNIQCSIRTFQLLERYGLAEEGDTLFPMRITHAGWTAICLYPLPAEPVVHKTRTFLYDHGTHLNWRKAQIQGDRSAWAKCTCGWKTLKDNREIARWAAQQHREEMAATATTGPA